MRSTLFKRWPFWLAVAGFFVIALLFPAKYSSYYYFPQGHKPFFFVWAILTFLAIIYAVLRFFLGKQRFDRQVLTFIQTLFARSRGDKQGGSKGAADG